MAADGSSGRFSPSSCRAWPYPANREGNDTMAQARQLVIGTVVAAGLLGGALVGAVGTAQAQGIVGGGGAYPTTGNMPVTTVAVAQFPAAGLDPPYNPA